MFDKTALITGGAGFIGSHVLDHLLNNGWYVKVIDNLSSGFLDNLEHNMDNSNVEIIVGDLKNFDIVRKAVEGVSTVFHYAANPEVRISTTHPRIHFKENVVTTFNLLEAIRESSVKYLVFASSSSVYGEPKQIPVPENAPLKPISVYGASKLACEALIHAYATLYDIKSVSLRYANVVGPRLRHGVIYDFITKLIKNTRRLEILGDGTQKRSFIYIEDAIRATMLALYHASESYEVYNVATENWITVKQVADIVVDALGLSNVKYIFKPTLRGVGWPGDVKEIALDIGKLKALGFKPKYDSIGAVKLTANALLNEVKISK